VSLLEICDSAMRGTHTDTPPNLSLVGRPVDVRLGSGAISWSMG
jgi:hypothetical protein